MALEIKPPPTLVGKVAEEFFERAANAKCNISKEEAQESMRATLKFLETQKHLHPMLWSI